MAFKYKKNRLQFYFIFLSLVFLCFNQTVRAQNQKPNIIFILGDDIGYKTLDINGGKSYYTPNLDSLARRGMNFTECHATPLCSPSRVMLLTGKHNFRNYTKWGFLDTSQKTIANMLKGAGYKTACFGKWQLAGGDASIRKFGFDNYCVWSPFDTSYYGFRYKNPILYTHNAFLPDSVTQNKYGEDIVADSLMSFMEKNKNAPFFIYYPMLLAHQPFQPTPDDTAFSSWAFALRSDTNYYSSMITYMDKKIGQIINKVKSLGIEDNTLIIYTGDNGTPEEIIEYTNDEGLLSGGKGSTTEKGTLVPMIISWPGVVKAGTTNNNLVGFTDFLPTLAHVANIAVPADYGPLDGVDFYPQLKGSQGTLRDWLFYHYDAHPGIDSLRRWAQTKTYKLYDTSLYNTTRLFYNIKKDVKERNPISQNSLTADELAIKQQLLKVINGYIKQGTVILAPAVVTNISNSSAMLEDSVEINGGSTIKAIGAVWSTKPNPDITLSPHSADGIISGPFQTSIKKLNANTTYYARVYAKNVAGTIYSNEIKFRTLLNSPVAVAATSVNESGFIAHWHSIKAASAYELDISTKPLFANITPLIVNQQFNHGITPPDGWTFIGSIGVNDTIHKTLSPALQFKASKAQVITKLLSGAATELKFWIKGIKTDTASALIVEGFNGAAWKTIKIIQPLFLTGTIKTFDSASLAGNFIQFRFTFLKSKGALAFDDVKINYNKISPLFVRGFNGLKLNDTAFIVAGLNASTNYYYRVRAINSNNSSDNSNTIPVVTCAPDGECGNSSILNSIENKLDVDIFPNPALNAFTVNIKGSSTKIEINVTDVYGKEVYQSAGSNNYIFGKEFKPGVYFLKIVQGKKSKTFKLIKGN